MSKTPSGKHPSRAKLKGSGIRPLGDPVERQLLNLEKGMIIGGRYRLIRKVGQGGMGIVWSAQDLRLYERPVAIKFSKFHDEPRKNKTNRHRFMREAFWSAQLSHPNLATIYEFFEYGEHGAWCMVFEFIAGETLLKYIRREKKLDPLTVTHIALQLAHVLGHMHNAGLVHRDLKPDNIMLTALQEPSQYLHLKLLDLGIAKLITPPREEASKTERLMQAPLTQTGLVCGTPEYMSPEQTMGLELAVTSDIYSVGILIFEMLTGAPPWRCHHWPDYIKKRRYASDLPPLEKFTSYHIPEELKQVLMRCIAYHPADRYQSTNELSHDLERVLFKAYGQILPLSNLHLSEHGRQELSLLAEQRSGHPLELNGQQLHDAQKPTVAPSELQIEVRAPKINIPHVDFIMAADDSEELEQSTQRAPHSTQAEISSMGEPVDEPMDKFVDRAQSARSSTLQDSQLSYSHLESARSAAHIASRRADALLWVQDKLSEGREVLERTDPSTRLLYWVAVATLFTFVSVSVFGGRSHSPQEVVSAPVDSQLKVPNTNQYSGVGPSPQAPKSDLKRQIEEEREKAKQKRLAREREQERLNEVLLQAGALFQKAKERAQLEDCKAQLESFTLDDPRLSMLKSRVNLLLELHTLVDKARLKPDPDKHIERLVKRKAYKSLQDHPLVTLWRAGPPMGL